MPQDSYTTPLDVWQRAGRNKRRETTETNVATNDLVELQEHVIGGSETVYANGSEISEYEIDTGNSTLVYKGNENVDLRIRYQTAPVPHSTVEDAIEQAMDRIDQDTETKFGGLVRVTDEVYESGGQTNQTFMLYKVPVREVENVEINTADSHTVKPDWKEADPDNYFRKSSIGLKFRGGANSSSPPNNKESIKTTYTFGYEDVPADIKEVAELITLKKLANSNVSGNTIDGRDNFTPDTLNIHDRDIADILQEWRRQYYNNMTGVTKYGEWEVL